MFEVLPMSECMPDWNRHEAGEIDRIDWQAITELAEAREPTPRAAQPGEA
jgi:hypothetical protein